ncbi:MAG: hypothetical protein HYV09_23290 [Deltaproteobacteria bacterium]|nr:hypothetical protein [Deltaproteobacteria bacterium]
MRSLVRALPLLSLLVACTRAEADPPKPAPVASSAATATATAAAPSTSASAPVKVTHPWLADAKPDLPKAHDTLEQRFPAPAGFVRVPVSSGSFGEFLRALPLAAPGSPVLTYQGKVLHDSSHPNVAAVVAIDVGKADLQQCADSVIRMHAEWQWSLGRRDQRYATAGGPAMSFAKYLAGERTYWKDGKLAIKNVGATPAKHEGFRAWLDQVFGSANTASLAKEAKPVAVADLRPGDFVVMPGVPFGHAVLVLDLARAPDGRRVALLGQGFMPAQSFHVLRRSPKETWFVIDEASGKLETPFWEPFPWSALRRLPE